MKNTILFNGKYARFDEIDECFTNRAFLYGDSVFETLRVYNGKIVFFREHLGRLTAAMKVLKYDVPDIFSGEADRFENKILSLLNRNRIFNSARVRISVYRKSGGLYAPASNDVNYLVTVSKLEDRYFVLNDKGLRLVLFNEVKKPINIFSPFKTANSLIFTLAGIHKTRVNADDCVILNENNDIAEAISSNIFTVKNKELITPPLSSGCIDGITRRFIVKTAKDNGIKFSEQNICEADLLNSEEVFLTNSVSGIRWVVAYKNRRYFKKLSVFFNDKLNEYLNCLG